MSVDALTLSTRTRRIRIGDLSRAVTEADVRGLLIPFGPVSSYVRPLDLATKRPGDYVLVEMNDPGASRAVEALHHLAFRDRILTARAYTLDATVLDATSPPAKARA